VNKITLKSPVDMHLHLRQGDMLNNIAHLSAKYFANAVIMPNTVPAIADLDALDIYKQDIIKSFKFDNMTPMMSLFFRNYSEAELIKAKDKIFGIKLYPQGATTNSDSGVDNLDEAETTFKIMEELQIPLLVHGEQADDFVLDREKNFLPVYEHLAKKYPKLKISMEHITTAKALELLDRYENLLATVTLQHLSITLDDVAGGLFNPHLFCKPIAKRPEDRDALLNAALSAHPKLMFGSDSAPHPRSSKECCGCAAGVFSAPIALAYLVDIFDKNNSLQNLQAFISDNAVKNYGFKLLNKEITLEKKDFIIPNQYSDVVPFMAGNTINWSYV